MVTAAEIVTLLDPPVPAGQTPWVGGARPLTDIVIVEPDASWPAVFETIAARIRAAVGARALTLEHVGSTAVPGLPAKPVIDVDLIVADPDQEAGWLGPLERAGFVLRVREPWWYGHRMLRLEGPAANLHVFGPDSAEHWRHLVFRDHLRCDAADRARYAAAKREAAAAATGHGEDMQQYTDRKESEVRRILHRAFVAAGLLDVPPGPPVR